MFGYKELNMVLQKAVKEDCPFYAVVVVVSPDRKQFLIGKRKEDNQYTSPAGGAKIGENPKHAAIREVFEESGIALTPRQLRELPVSYARNGKVVHRFISILKEKQKPHTKNDPDKEVWQWRWIDVDSRLPEPMDEPRQNTFTEARLWLNNLRKSELELKETLEKGKRAAIGEVRTWHGQDYRKIGEGQWVPVTGRGMSQPVNEKMMDRKGIPVAGGKTSEGPGAQKLDRKALDHHLSHGSFSLITAENPNAKQLSPEENKKRMDELKSALTAKGATFHEAEGHYGGNTENALMVHHTGDITPQVIEDLGKQYEQESVIHSFNGKHVMPYTHGENEGQHVKGSGHEMGDFDSDYTSIDGNKFRLNFDFGNKHPDMPGEAPDHLKNMVDSLKAKGLSKETVMNALNQRGYDKNLADQHWESGEPTKKALASSEQAGIDINTADYAMEEHQAEKSDWMDLLKLNLSRVNFDISEPNREIPLEGKYLLSAAQVDEGIYDGYVKLDDVESGDHGKVLFQIKKMTLPAMIEALKAKGFISTPKELPKDEMADLLTALNAGTARNININIYKSLENRLKGLK